MDRDFLLLTGSHTMHPNEDRLILPTATKLLNARRIATRYEVAPPRPNLERAVPTLAILISCSDT